ncbi:hypothetical protein AM587_10002565 [Phytophthora nicotianae]|uniref:Uncharacterized protein n=1 Tax=Phytophthora nicotianae TaxID=4792 RepID=A0A0W8C037_PHYNI|nr:hypothetical protein AM587_10002565 [Phytophthora nicotianae]
MLKRHLTTTTGAKKTLVLATGALTKGLKSCVDAYLKAQWHVQLVTLDSCYKKSDWQFTQLDGFHEALNVLELETWSMQIPQQQELTRVAQQASDKQLAIRMAEEEEMQLKLLQEYEKAQEEEPWTWA